MVWQSEFRDRSFIKVYGGRDRFWDHEIFPVYLGGSWNFFGLFGWVIKISGFTWVGHENLWLYLGGSWKIPALFGSVTKYFLKFWVGHGTSFEILGGSWNSPWNFGWVMKIFQTFENVSRPLWTIIYVRSLRDVTAQVVPSSQTVPTVQLWMRV